MLYILNVRLILAYRIEVVVLITREFLPAMNRILNILLMNQLEGSRFSYNII